MSNIDANNILLYGAHTPSIISYFVKGIVGYPPFRTDSFTKGTATGECEKKL